MEVIRKQRGTVKAKLTRLETKVENAEHAGEICRATTEVYTARLEDIRTEFDDVQRQVMAIQVSDSLQPENQETEDEEFEDRYLDLKVRLKQMLIRLPIPQKEERSLPQDDALTRILQQQAELIKQLGNNGAGGPSMSGVSNDSMTQLITQQTELLRRFTEGDRTVNESKVRLPVIKLPTFDGRTEDWKRFSETFQSLIHDNTTIPQIQKFQYLSTSLSGEAAKIVESIELTGANYTIAWNLLNKRYDDPRAIKKKHIQYLFTMPKVEKESASAIRELVDYTLKHLRILKSMELPTDEWNELIIHMIETKLDIVTLRAWEQDGNPAVGTLENFTDFLQTRCQTLERIEARSKQNETIVKGEIEKQNWKSRNQVKSTQSNKSSTLMTSTDSEKCYLCQEDHFLYHCGKFLAMPVSLRIKEVQRMKLCMNCLRCNHFAKASGKAQTQKEKEGASEDTFGVSKSSSNVSVHHAANGPKRQHIIMATAIVNATRPNGSSVTIRILLDSASEANFVTHTACNKLGVKRDRTAETITGLNQMESRICQSCDIVLQSRHSNYQLNVHCLVLPTITKSLPSVEIDRSAVQIPFNIKLADFEFHKPSSIDMLVGAEFFFELLEAEKIDLGESRLVLQNTKLGWVIAGSIVPNDTTSLVCSRNTITTLSCSVEHCETLNKNLEKFWELESVQSETNRALSPDERECEEFFERTTTRDENGRFIVRLPFREESSKLGKSRDTAVRRLIQLERRFKNNKTLQERYVEFMREYQELGHMSATVNVSQNRQCPITYLPHHGVMKESSSSTKLRTVFDASSKTDSGVALNDVLHVGPTLQSSLIEVIMRFRWHNVALIGDLRKMYRQIIVHPDDRDYQRILWRKSPEDPVQEFQLNTVTYGEASSSYLAIKCVRRLAEQAEHEYPIAAKVILDEMYVDDIMTGADDVQGVMKLQQQLTAVLIAGGFEIHKWCSSCPESVAHLPSEQREDIATHSIDDYDTIKTLGLEWNPINDEFQFSVQQPEVVATKRQMLSAISKFFDPLGLIGPILTTAKLLMQDTCASKQIGMKDFQKPLMRSGKDFGRI